MNAIAYLVSKIKQNIPNRVLEYGIRNRNIPNERLVSIDKLIETKIIRRIMILDMDVYGSNQITIPINQCDVKHRGLTNTTIYVPKRLTNNRVIVTATLSHIGDPYNDGASSITNSTMGANTTSECGLSGISGDLNKMYQNISPPVDVSLSADLVVIGDNLINIEGYVDLTYGVFNCIIENDALLNNINSRSLIPLSRMAVLATKKHIYNEVIINLNEGYISQGHTNTAIQNIIEKWDDSEEEYNIYFETKWKQISLMNDKKRKSTLLKLMIGNNNTST